MAITSLSLTLTWEGHQVRMVGTPDRPEWIASDICAALDLRGPNPWKHLPSSERGKHSALTPGGWQLVVTVTEPGLYRLVFQSRKPDAKRFRAWVVREVLPSIRRHGRYPPPAPADAPLPDLRDPKQLAALTLQLTLILAEKDQRIEQLEPKAAAHDRLQEASGTVSLMTAGRILGRQPRLLMRTLEGDGVLVRGERGRLMPSARCREQGLFVVREILVGVGDEGADDKAVPQTLVTTRGLQWLAARYRPTDAIAESSRGVGESNEPPVLPSGGGEAPARQRVNSARPPRLSSSPRPREMEH